uniref:Protein-tyrosine phosphatase n=1 Tax=Panagrellus redivivus TaxID=6233 RepID=A0A7E4V331_PANRE
MSASQMERLKKGGGQNANSSSTAKKEKKARIKVLGKTSVSPEAENAINAFIQATVSAGVEGIRKEFLEVKSYVGPDVTHEKFNANRDRNRYNDIICLDATRVVLSLNVPPDTDYIHANWIKMDGVERQFIATQGPLDNTIGDFWRMVFQENVPVVLMLCKCEEDGKVKCSQYWPAESGGYKTYSGMFVNNKRVEKEDRFCTYTLEILPEGCSNSNIVKLIQVIDWPDKGVPSSGMSILRLLKMIATGSLGSGPAVVHCSAGIGRTGTLLAIETVIQRLWKGQTIDFKEVVKQMRNQRALMMQTDHQYIFAHLSVMYYISAKIPKHREAVMTFHEQYKQSVP